MNLLIENALLIGASCYLCRLIELYEKSSFKHYYSGL